MGLYSKGLGALENDIFFFKQIKSIGKEFEYIPCSISLSQIVKGL